LEAHYCHGQFAGVKFVYNSCCCDEKKADCCEDKIIQVEKADFDYAPQQVNEVAASDKPFCGSVIWECNGTAHSCSAHKKINSRGSPPDDRPELYIFYQRLLFYG